MCGVPPAIYDVHYVGKAGWPTRREPHGHGIPRGVSERESRLHGEVGETDQCHVNKGRRNATCCR